MNINAKKYILIYSITFTLAVIFISGLTVYIDPYFHYHKPVDGFTYVLNNVRYQNDGILKNFDYDAMITGSSMADNFKTSELDNLFGLSSVKTALYASRFKEIDGSIRTSIEYNSNLKVVFRGIDLFRVNIDKDFMNYAIDTYPWYLYDDNIFNDVSYVLNKETLLTITIPVFKTIGNTSITSFDDYSNWMSTSEIGKDAALNYYKRSNEIVENKELTDSDIEKINGNLWQNVVEVVSENPEIEFFYFITPCGILWWDEMLRKGELLQVFEMEKILIESLLPYENCKLFSFNTEFELITNLDNYKDTIHYHEDINSYMLEQMAKGENLLTYDNYEQYLQECYDFYSNYDYDSIFE